MDGNARSAGKFLPTRERSVLSDWSGRNGGPSIDSWGIIATAGKCKWAACCLNLHVPCESDGVRSWPAYRSSRCGRPQSLR